MYYGAYHVRDSERRFAFEAFLPRDKKERAAILQELKDETRTIIIYEAPHHLVKTLEELYDTLGDRQISICRELTKRYEEKMRTTLSDSLVYYGENEPRGEYVLVIHGKTFEELAEEARKSWEDMSLEEHMQDYEKEIFGSDYNEISFHQAVLSIGPAPFQIVKDYLKDFYQK